MTNSRFENISGKDIGERGRAYVVLAAGIVAIALISSAWMLSGRASSGASQETAIATLRVFSEPEGAMVTVDGVPRGLTPLTVTGLAEGRHTVRLEKDGFAPKILESMPTAYGEMQIHASLTVAGAPPPRIADTTVPDIAEDEPFESPVVSRHGEEHVEKDRPRRRPPGARRDPRLPPDPVEEFDKAPFVATTPGVSGGTGGRGNPRVARRTGVKSQQTAVDLALEWLANHQSPDGSWDADGFHAQCKLNRCSGPGEAQYDPGATALATLAFLGRGETHNSGPYKDTVKNALRYLKSIQDSEGRFGPQNNYQKQYNNFMATLAMTEAYGLSGSRLFKEPAQRGVDFVHKSQNPYLAWRYGVRDGDNDTSVTGWAVAALTSAKMAELDVDAGAFRGALAWIDKMTEPEFGRVGYQRRGGPPARTQGMADKFPADESESLTGVGMLVRIFCGQDPAKNEFIEKGAQLLLKKPARWDVEAGTIDSYYWFWGSLAMYQVGGRSWTHWSQSVDAALVPHQRMTRGRDERGSWDPIGPWGAEGGRVYSTALNCLTLETTYRYGRVFGR